VPELVSKANASASLPEFPPARANGSDNSPEDREYILGRCVTESRKKYDRLKRSNAEIAKTIGDGSCVRIVTAPVLMLIETNLPTQFTTTKLQAASNKTCRERSGSGAPPCAARSSECVYRTTFLFYFRALLSRTESLLCAESHRIFAVCQVLEKRRKRRSPPKNSKKIAYSLCFLPIDAGVCIN